MQKNKKIISETTELTTRISLFFIQTTLHNSSKNASHHSSLGTEPNSAGFHFFILSHNCLIFLSNSISQDKPEQMYLTFSRCKGLSRFQAHIPENWYFALTPSSWYDRSLLPWEEPTWDRTHAWMAPESAFQKPETAREPVVTTKFLGELFPWKWGFLHLMVPNSFLGSSKWNSTQNLGCEANSAGTSCASPNTAALLSC